MSNNQWFHCELCGKNTKNMGPHLKNTHGISILDYKRDFDPDSEYTRYCIWCEKDLKGTKQKNTCSSKCHYLISKNKKYEKDLNVKQCKICGLKGHNLTGHISKEHGLSVEEYLIKFNLTKDDVMSTAYREKISENKKGDKNPAKDHGGRYSPYSKNFTKYDGLTDEEKEEQISIVCKNRNRPPESIPNRIEYWLDKGYSYEEARYQLRERQATGRLDKFQERYGEEEGYRRWIERQEKWQNTLNSKSKEEQDRIQRAKMNFNKSYSRISQDLFWVLFDYIYKDFDKIYFATLNENFKFDNSGKNYEFLIKRSDSKVAFLDFYIPEVNKAIEFDGEYWHGEGTGNKERDAIREQRIKEKNPEIEIYRVRERDYRNNPSEVISNCLDFIYSG